MLWDSPLVVHILIGLAALLCIPLAIGWHDRWAAVAILYVWACLYGRNPLISSPPLPYVGWLLLTHSFTPRAPYGSVDRRGDPDPGSSWRMPDWIFAATWIAMALGYTYSGYSKLINPILDGTAILRIFIKPLPILKIATWGKLAMGCCLLPWLCSRAFG